MVAGLSQNREHVLLIPWWCLAACATLLLFLSAALCCLCFLPEHSAIIPLMFPHDSLKGKGWEKAFWIIKWLMCTFRNLCKNGVPHVKLNVRSSICSLGE